MNPQIDISLYVRHEMTGYSVATLNANIKQHHNTLVRELPPRRARTGKSGTLRTISGLDLDI